MSENTSKSNYLCDQKHCSSSHRQNYWRFRFPRRRDTRIHGLQSTGRIPSALAFFDSRSSHNTVGIVWSYASISRGIPPLADRNSSDCEYRNRSSPSRDPPIHSFAAVRLNWDWRPQYPRCSERLLAHRFANWGEKQYSWTVLPSPILLLRSAWLLARDLFEKGFCLDSQCVGFPS